MSGNKPKAPPEESLPLTSCGCVSHPKWRTNSCNAPGGCMHEMRGGKPHLGDIGYEMTVTDQDKEEHRQTWTQACVEDNRTLNNRNTINHESHQLQTVSWCAVNSEASSDSYKSLSSTSPLAIHIELKSMHVSAWSNYLRGAVSLSCIVFPVV